MKTARKIIALVALAPLLALLAVPASPQGTNSRDSILAVYRYDLDSTSERYCVLSGTEYRIDVPVSASSSTTLTGTNAFTDVAVGDFLRGQDSVAGGSETYMASVVARASASSITVDSALNLSSATLYSRKLSCGTGVNDGAFGVAAFGSVTIQVDVEQLNATGGIDARIQCRTRPGGPWVQKAPAVSAGTTSASYVNLSAVGSWSYELSGTYAQCRVGMLIQTSDDGGDTGSNAEQVSVSIQARN